MTTSKRESKERQKRLNQGINKRAKALNLPGELIRYQVAFEGFLERVFKPESDEWVLKGGASLLMRNRQGRTTTDIDLARDVLGGLEDIDSEIREIAGRPGHGPLTYRVKSVRIKGSGTEDGYSGPTYEASIDAMMGAVVFQPFSLDLTVQRHTQEPHERVEIHPVLAELTSEELEPFFVFATAIESQLADKICAMREKHRSGDSNRYHDLADIITILLTQSFSAEKLVTSCKHEARRRRIDYPTEIWVPSMWETEYTQKAESFFGLPAQYRDLSNAMAFASEVLNPALAGELTEALWDPGKRSWQSPA